MTRPLKEFAYYHNGEHIKNGTKKELAAYIGVSESVISNHITATNREGGVNGIQILGLEPDPVYVECDTARVRKLIKKEKLNLRILSEWLGINYNTFAFKVRGAYRFKEEEVKELEGIFRLEEGALLKGG